MNITIELTGIAPLADAINNLAEALKAGAKADQIIETAKTRSRKPKAETSPESPPVEAAPEQPASTASTETEPPTGTAEPVAATEAAPPAPTAEEARKAVLTVAREKGHDAAAALLGQFGAKKLSEVKADDFAALIAAAKAE